MNITPVSTSSNAIFSPPKGNDIIKLLEKQKMQLQDQIQKVNESKMDDKAKQERIKQLQDQIQQIDAEIRQKQAEMYKEQTANTNTDTNQQTVDTRTNGDDNGLSSDLNGMSDLVRANSSFSQTKLINNIKTDVRNKIPILMREIKEDEARSLSGATATAKREEASKLQSREDNLHNKVFETLQTAQDKVKEASRHESGDDDPDENKIDKSKTDKSKADNDIDKASEAQSKLSEDKSEEEDSKKQALKGTGIAYKKIDIRI